MGLNYTGPHTHKFVSINLHSSTDLKSSVDPCSSNLCAVQVSPGSCAYMDVEGQLKLYKDFQLCRQLVLLCQHYTPPPTLFKGQLWKVMWYAGKHLDIKQLLKKSFFIALNDFCGENTPIKLDFNPLMWQHWIQCWEGMYTCTWARIVFS